MEHQRALAISTHALREEGDGLAARNSNNGTTFLPTPSARRATVDARPANTDPSISTHALREEGDPAGRRSPSGPGQFLPTPSARRATLCCGILYRHASISTHALRKEGDCRRRAGGRRGRDFYPRPPRGGRPSGTCSISGMGKFLPTPSARRATRRQFLRAARELISTHALREEGDLHPPRPHRRPAHISTHALREEGDMGTS